MQRILQQLSNSADRGKFRLLEASRVDLPMASEGTCQCWIPKLPAVHRAMFTDPKHLDLLNPVVIGIRNSKSVPLARVHAKEGEYPKVLLKADIGGMLDWSIVSNEDAQYRHLANALTISSFAVCKDEQRDRLISWPRVQNLYMPDPPYTDLPNASHFDKIREPQCLDLAGFYFDVGNMFHNIKMPVALARFFPLRQIRFGDLSEHLQKRLSKQLGNTLTDSVMLRPIQTTLPMGFKWAVYIAHTFAHECFREAFMSSAIILAKHNSLLTLNNEIGTINMKSGDALLLHIIDDIDVLCVSWSEEDIVALHKECEHVFEVNFLPIKRKKSLPLGTVAGRHLELIGWDWSLQRGQCVLDPRRYGTLFCKSMFSDTVSASTQRLLKN